MNTIRRLCVLLAAFLLCAAGTLLPAAAAGPPKILPAAPPEQETNLFYDVACVYVPQNIHGGLWRVYCPYRGDAGTRDIVRIRDEAGNAANIDRNWADGRYSARSGSTQDFTNLSVAWHAWYDNECSTRFFGYSLSGPNTIDTCRAAQPSRPQNLPLKDHRGYLENSFWEPSENEHVVRPCALLLYMAGGTKINCVDPSKQDPCPPDRLGQTLLDTCRSENQAFATRYKWWGEDAAGPASTACEARGGVMCDPKKRGAVTTSKDAGGVKFLEDPIQWTQKTFEGAAAEVITWWLEVPPPRVVDDPTTTIKNEQNVNFLVRHTNVFTLALVTLSVLIACIRMSLTRDPSHAGSVLKSMAILILVTATSVAAMDLWVRACSAYGDWIMVRGLNPTYTGSVDGGNAQQLTDDAVAAFTGGLSDANFFVDVLGSLFLIAGGLVQWGYATAAPFVVVLCLGFMPLSAAATNTQAGRELLARIITVGFAFSTIGALQRTVFVVFARGWAPQDATNMTTEMEFRGIFLLAVMSLLAPALIKMMFPLAAAAAGGQAAATAMVTGVMATGARVIRR